MEYNLLQVLHQIVKDHVVLVKNNIFLNKDNIVVDNDHIVTDKDQSAIKYLILNPKQNGHDI